MVGASSSSAAFWASFLASAHPLLELPVDKTRPSSRSTELDYVSWSLPASCGPQLAEAAARAGTTPVLLVLAAWQALLARMSRQDNVTLGVMPSSLLQQQCSRAPSAEHGGGDDAKTPPRVALLPLSTPVDLEADCLSGLAARNARLLGQVAPHAHMALQDICAAAQKVPSAAYHPLFQAAFLMAPAGCRAADGRALAAAALSAGPPSRSALSARLIASAFNDDGCDEDSSAAGVPAAPLDLLLLLQGDSLPEGGGHAARARVAGPVAGLLAFSCDIFERQMVELLARHLEVLLTSALSTPTAALAGLAMMSPQEHQQVLHGFNATAVPLTDASLVHQCFARCAVNQPGAACLVYEGETMSYGEVDAVSNRLANTLIQRCGVREGDVVGLLMHRSANMVAGLLGVLKSGAAYLPLDAGHPPDRTAYILADAGVKVVVVQPELAHLLPPQSTPDTGSGGGVLHVVLPSTGLGGELLAASTASPGQLGRPDDLAYVIYTSGSTGNPKGVMVTHANLAHFLAWERAEFGYSVGDVFLHKTPTNFDVSVEELWTPLSCGACLVVAKPGGHKDTGYLATLMERHGVRTLSMVPSQIAMLLLEADAARLPALKRIVAAGEALTSSLARQVHEVLPHVELVNGYGPTEATVYITHHVVRCGEVGARPTASIGRPLANATAYVVDAANRLAPIGVPGELAVSGPQITRGYLNLPDKTAAVFVPSPYRLGPGSCTDVMYRTGDLARWLPDGRLECLGRTDHQVKLRGYRIELQEIESALSAHDGIQAAVCAIVKDGAGQARLAAYVERPLTGAAASGLLDRAAVRRSLARRLPAYMLPDVLVVLPQLPRLSNEKINRKALPMPDWAADAFGCSGPAAPSVASANGGGGGQSYTAKQLAADAVLAAAVAAWAGALGVDPAGLGPGSDFAGLGGNSLQAGLMAAALRKALQLPHLSGLLVYSHSQLGAFVREVKVAAAVSCKAAAPEGMLAGVAPQLLVSGSTAASTVAYSSVVAPGSASVSGGRCGPSALPLWVATVLQLLAAAVVMGMQILINLAPLVTVQFLMASGSEWEALAAIPMAKAVAILSSVVLHVGAKWLLVGRYKEGLTPIYGLHYVAAWVEKLLFRSVQAQLLPFIRGTALMNAYLNALGARVHASAFVDAEDVFEPDLIEVQAGAFVGGNCVLAGATRRAATSKQGEPGGAYRYGSVAYNKVSVGARAVVGPLCVLAGAGASLPDAAVLPPNSSSTDPAALKRGQAMRPEVLRCADRPLGAGPAAAALAVVVLFESALLVPATVVFVLMWDVLVVSTGDPSPAVMLACWQTPATQRSTQMNGVCGEAMHGELLSLALFPIVYLLSTLLLVPPVLVLAKWLLMGRVTATKLRSTHPLRVWTTHVWVLLQRCWSVRMVTHMLQGTGAYNTLLRALGFKVGRQAWISNANISLVTPDMVSIGATASMGSDVHFYNATDAHEGAIVIGDAADVGHQATLYPGAMLQPGAVLGAKSNVLASETLQAGAIRLGNMLLHHGTAAKDVESSTSCSSVSSAAAELVRARIIPTWRYVCCNIAVLAGSALLVPVTYMLLSLPMLAVLMVALWEGSGLLVAPAVLLGFLLNITAILAWMALLRRLLVHSSPGVRPFWSSFFVRWMIWDGPLNVVNTAFTPFFGSAIIIWLYRAIGCQVGGGCCLFGGYPGEPDALVIGDGAVLEPYAGASTHTIERRQLTISTVRVHERATAGVYSLLLPGAELEAGARLENCSVLLKGERAAAGSTWRGIPAEPVW